MEKPFVLPLVTTWKHQIIVTHPVVQLLLLQKVKDNIVNVKLDMLNFSFLLDSYFKIWQVTWYKLCTDQAPIRLHCL